MAYARFLQSLHLTHAPYWVASVFLVILVRRVRRSLESIAATLKAQHPTEP
jgi:hypothetical protein